MEVGLNSSLHTYSGGLGVLAGDILKSAADLSISMIGVTLLYRKGYFQQNLSRDGVQTESYEKWPVEKYLVPLDKTLSVQLAGRKITFTAWKYEIKGIGGHVVPVYFLDTFHPDNSNQDKTVTDFLYGGDKIYRLTQESILGLGGVQLLKYLSHNIKVYHMNEGHSALLTLELLAEEAGDLSLVKQKHIETVKNKCIFTTHTPIAAGHDHFTIETSEKVLGKKYIDFLKRNEQGWNELNMSHLALSFSRFTNGVARRHAEVAREMFPQTKIQGITNGIHSRTWVSSSMESLFDRYIPDWKYQNFHLRHAFQIPLKSIERGHTESKIHLFREIEQKTGKKLDTNVFTIGYARRATEYKRAALLFHDPERLKKISQKWGPIQVIFSGKAHPRDQGGKKIIEQVFRAGRDLSENISFVYLEGYNMDLAHSICSGVDLWLNTPEKPLEASGTSGMKSALNGVPSLSVLDGWWVEGHVEGITGWSIGDDTDPENNPEKESLLLYQKLENAILPLYYENRAGYTRVRQGAIALNASYFNGQRMLTQYLSTAYRSEGQRASGPSKEKIS